MTATRIKRRKERLARPCNHFWTPRRQTPDESLHRSISQGGVAGGNPKETNVMRCVYVRHA